MKKINPDDVEDVDELINELKEWINDRKERMDPALAAFLLISIGADIAHSHCTCPEDFRALVEKALSLGVAWAQPE